MSIKKLSCFILILMLLMPLATYATQIPSEPLDIVFVIDCSQSLEALSPKKIFSSINMVIDLLPSQSTRVGFVAYNHTIIDTEELIPLSNLSKINHLKQQIYNLPTSGYTDTGLSLKKGHELLSSSLENESSQPLLILISDGEIALPPYGTRTESMSHEDFSTTVQTTQSQDLPLHIVSLGNGMIADTTLQSFIKSAKIPSHNAPDANSLSNTLISIINPYLPNDIVAFTLSSSAHTYSVDINNTLMSEFAIAYAPTSTECNPTISYNNERIFLDNQHGYSIKNFIPHAIGSLEFVLTPKSNNYAHCYIANYYTLSLKEHLPKATKKHKPLSIYYQFINTQTHSPIINHNLYKTLRSSFTLQHNNAPIPFNAQATEDRLTIHFTPSTSGTYITDLKFKPTLAPLITFANTFEITNTSPSGFFNSSIRNPVNKKSCHYNLNTYFSDIDGDSLTYELIDNTLSNENIQLQDSSLTIHNITSEQGSFAIKATDPEGLSVTTPEIKVSMVPLLEYYIQISIIVIILLATLLTLLILYRKKISSSVYFTGKFECYILPNISQKDILHFPLYSFSKHKKISLSMLLISSKLQPLSPYAHTIYFKPSSNKALIIYHSSPATLYLNGSILLKNKYYILSPNDYVTISFDESLPTLECHYLSFSSSDMNESKIG